MEQTHWVDSDPGTSEGGLWVTAYSLGTCSRPSLPLLSASLLKKKKQQPKTQQKTSQPLPPVLYQFQ